MPAVWASLNSDSSIKIAMQTQSGIPYMLQKFGQKLWEWWIIVKWHNPRGCDPEAPGGDDYAESPRYIKNPEMPCACVPRWSPSQKAHIVHKGEDHHLHLWGERRWWDVFSSNHADQ